MKAIIEHAREIADLLSKSLAKLEALVTNVTDDTVRSAILSAWMMVVGDVECGRATMSSSYLASLHAKLATSAELTDPGGFAEHGLPILPDGTRESWSRFAQDCRYEDDSEGLEEEYALAQLRWGEHVRTFALTLGWFAMNIVRMRRGQHAVYPPATDHDRLQRLLKDAGPDTYDLEGGLRGLAREYAGQQVPGGWGIA